MRAGNSFFCVFLLAVGVAGCRTRGALTGEGSSSRMLESREPIPGETENRPIMDSTTFGTGSAGWGRDGTELEGVKSVSGLDSKEIQAFAEFKSGTSTRTEFQRMAKPGYAVAFSLGAKGETREQIDLLPWSKSDHEVREANPYVSLTIESDRVLFDVATKAWDLSIGTDYNVDLYYDTPNYLLLANGALIRSRNRMDMPGEIRRILIQSKMSLGVNAEGLKSAAKKDIRSDASDIGIVERMDKATKSGRNVLHGEDTATAEPIEAIKSVYFTLKEKNVLPDLDGKTGVLLLNPQAAVLSVRGRYHLNFTSLSAMKALSDLGVMVMNEAQQAATGLSPEAQGEMAKIISGLADQSAILEVARPEIEMLSPGLPVDAPMIARLLEVDSLSLKSDIAIAHVVMQARNKVLKRFAKIMDQLGNDWNLKRRQVEAAGSMGLARWFRRASNVYAGSQPWGNFLIDTFDYSKALTFDDFNALSDDMKLMKGSVPANKVYFASLVNEVQIELGLEKPFVKCMERSASAPDDVELRKDADMCRMLLANLTAAQEFIANKRGEEVRRSAQRAGITNPNLKWTSGEASKGENALRIAREIPRTLP